MSKHSSDVNSLVRVMNVSYSIDSYLIFLCKTSAFKDKEQNLGIATVWRRFQWEPDGHKTIKLSFCEDQNQGFCPAWASGMASQAVFIQQSAARGEAAGSSYGGAHAGSF